MIGARENDHDALAEASEEGQLAAAKEAGAACQQDDVVGRDHVHEERGPVRGLHRKDPAAGGGPQKPRRAARLPSSSRNGQGGSFQSSREPGPAVVKWPDLTVHVLRAGGTVSPRIPTLIDSHRGDAQLLEALLEARVEAGDLVQPYKDSRGARRH
jgi:hypothetical protein